MVRMGEHIDGADTAHGVALLGEQGEVAGESFGVTGDIHDLLRLMAARESMNFLVLPALGGSMNTTSAVSPARASSCMKSPASAQ